MRAYLFIFSFTSIDLVIALFSFCSQIPAYTVAEEDIRKRHSYTGRITGRLCGIKVIAGMCIIS